MAPPIPHDCVENCRTILEQHEKRMDSLERDINMLLVAQKALEVSVHKIEIAVTSLTREVGDHIRQMEDHWTSLANDIKVTAKSDLLAHENREFDNHRQVLKEIVKVLAMSGLFGFLLLFFVLIGMFKLYVAQ
jgi:Fe2+ transport system protein B